MFERGASDALLLGPVLIDVGKISLRTISSGDGPRWSQLRMKNEKYLRPWEPTIKDWADYHQPRNWRRIYPLLKKKGKEGRIISLVIEVDNIYVGQLTVGNIVFGALSSAWIGYWVDQDYARKGVATAACALVVDYAFQQMGLHRIEATVQKENIASIKVLTKLGFRQEGLLHRYMNIDGKWCDHLLFALTAEENFVGSLARIKFYPV